eukprot:11195164-Lingulodinium_polyedra.AAC.1
MCSACVRGIPFHLKTRRGCGMPPRCGSGRVSAFCAWGTRALFVPARRRTADSSAMSSRAQRDLLAN